MLLDVVGLNKSYPTFNLKDVSFSVEGGSITGFVGRNGAGKTTTLKCLLNLVHPDSGAIKIFGLDFKGHEQEIKERVGYVLGDTIFYSNTAVKKLTNVYKRFYKNWNEKLYREYLKRFNIDENKRIKELSTGMRIKYTLSLALSHGAELFIFDEPTSGLDPIAREELTDLFREIVADGEKSILFSTHITSDLDKCADYVVYIKDGAIVMNKPKDAIIDEHALVAGKKSDLTPELSSRLVGFKENAFGFTGLIKRENIIPGDSFETEKPNVEDIMIYYDCASHSSETLGGGLISASDSEVK